MSDKVIEQNIAFMLTETTGKIQQEIKVNIFPNGRAMTPYGAFELAKHLINWATSVDKDVKAIVNSNLWRN